MKVSAGGELQLWVPSEGKIPSSARNSLLRIWSSSHQKYYYLFSSEGFQTDPDSDGEQKKFVWSSSSLPLASFSRILCFQSWRPKSCLHSQSRTAQQTGDDYLPIYLDWSIIYLSSIYLSIFATNSISWEGFLVSSSQVILTLSLVCSNEHLSVSQEVQAFQQEIKPLLNTERNIQSHSQESWDLNWDLFQAKRTREAE